MRKLKFQVLTTALVWFTLTPPALAQSKADRRPRDITDASIVQLIARPEAYDGKFVRLMGYVHWEFEGNGVYLHEDDWKHHLYRNGLWVEPKSGLPEQLNCQDQYVIIEGTFRAADHGHLGMWSGAIMDIVRCDPWH